MRFEEAYEGWNEGRLEQMSNRRAPVDEVLALTDLYRRRHRGWNVKHLHSWYRKDGGTRSYTWVKSRQQEAKLVPKAEKRIGNSTRHAGVSSTLAATVNRRFCT
jgi:hypothetical protein